MSRSVRHGHGGGIRVTGTTWHEFERRTYETTTAGFGEEINLAERLVNHVIDGLRELEGPEADRGVQRLVRVLVVRAIHCLNAAFDLVLGGHYVEAASLTRTAYECWLAGAYVCCMPSEAPSLMREGREWPQPSCMRRVVAASLSKDLREGDLMKKELGRMYRDLSKLTHVSFTCLASAIDDEGSLQYGPFFSRNKLLICLDFAYRTAVLTHHLLERAFPLLARTPWAQKTRLLAAEAKDWASRVSA